VAFKFMRSRRGGLDSFHGRLVVVTGAGSGIGRATALAFAREGAVVVAADIDAATAEGTAQQARAAGGAAHSARVDVSDAAAMERFAEDVEREHGVPDVVVNNAGIGLAGPFLETGKDDWERILGVNLWGVIHGLRLFGEQMVRRGEGGHLVNLASAASFMPSRQLPAYGTTKAGVLMLSECLRIELAGAGIGVTAICPGIIDTNITRSSRYLGVSAEEERQRREAAAQLYRRRNFGPERVAEEILKAVRRNAAVVPVSPEAKFVRALSRVSPAAQRALARAIPDPY
jgi:NAD(P)-dependent dehydrogenase (short-subunit alcohol dehydrogenase family)